MENSNKKIDLNEKDFEFICPVQTKDMTAIDEGYFCSKCEKKVYDVSTYTKDEFTELKRKNDNLCVNFTKVVTTTLILTSTLSIASNLVNFSKKNSIQKTYNKLSPVSNFDFNQSIFIEYHEEVELGGGFAPVTIFEPDDDIWVPTEAVENPPSKKDGNTTNAHSKNKQHL